MTDFKAREEQLRTRLAELMGVVFTASMTNSKSLLRKIGRTTLSTQRWMKCSRVLAMQVRPRRKRFMPLFSASRAEPTANVSGVERTSQKNV